MAGLRCYEVALLALLCVSNWAQAEVIYKCAKDDYVSYGFGARESFDCKPMTLAEAYGENVVPRELHLSCEGVEKSTMIDPVHQTAYPVDSKRSSETFHFLGGRLNSEACLWMKNHISCGFPDRGAVISLHTGMLSIDRYTGDTSYTHAFDKLLYKFDGKCVATTFRKF